MPERYGKWESIATRFYRWQKTGVWNQILENLKAIADQKGNLDWEVHYVDGAICLENKTATVSCGLYREYFSDYFIKKTAILNHS